MDYSKLFNPTKTPQTKPIPGMNQVRNNAGGYGFAIDLWKRIERFLILGAEGGTYYVGEAELTAQNGETIMQALRENGCRLVEMLVAISEEGRAHKNDPATFALALAAAHGDPLAKSAARHAIHRVCRTGTHLFQFMEMYKGVGGKQTTAWKKGVSKFYTLRKPEALALQLVKYRQRGGWSHRDVVRLAHPAGKGGGALQNVLRFAAGKEMVGEYPAILDGFTRIQGTTNAREAAGLIREHNLPWEAVPTTLHKEKLVWDALVEKMPYTATLRNLGRLGSLGFFGSDLAGDTKMIADRLANPEFVKQARVHPFSILLAYSTYMNGRGVKGDLTWGVSSQILDALEAAFFASFTNVVPTGKNLLVAVDGSGSMTSARVANTHLSVAEAALVMAYVHSRVEKNVELIAFAGSLIRLGIPIRSTTLRELLKAAQGWPGSSTDCSIPFKHALNQKIHVDAFITYTDNETWAGRSGHPVELLAEYRKRHNADAKAIDVAMVATQHSIGNPNDPRTMSIAGMDPTVPAVVTDFIRGEQM